MGGERESAKSKRRLAKLREVAQRRKQGRVFRALFLAVYVLVAGIFSVMLFVGVLSHLRGGAPGGDVPPISAGACVEEAERLRAELVERLSTFASTLSDRREGRAFEDWASSFRTRIASAKRGCSPPKGASPEQTKAIRTAFDDLRKVVDRSEILATHWLRHLGPALHESETSLEAARVAR